jgi:hypothetical protein
MGVVNEPDSDLDALPRDAPAGDVPTTGGGAVSRDPVRGGDLGRGFVENDSGAPSGQLADTNVEAALTPVTIGEREEIESDRTDGYWRIG